MLTRSHSARAYLTHTNISSDSFDSTMLFFLSHSMSLILYVAGGGTKDFQTSVKDLKSIATFARAVVKDGTWIFYKYKDFNDKPDNKESWVKLLTPGEHEVDISNVNGSVDLLPQESEGIVLFEHAFYGGTRKVTIKLRIYKDYISIQILCFIFILMIEWQFTFMLPIFQNKVVKNTSYYHYQYVALNCSYITKGVALIPFLEAL